MHQFHTQVQKTVVRRTCGPSWCSTLFSLVEATEQTDGRHPAIHVLLGLSHQVPGPLLRLQVEDEGALQLLLGEGQASIHLEDKGKRHADGPQ